MLRAQSASDRLSPFTRPRFFQSTCASRRDGSCTHGCFMHFTYSAYETRIKSPRLWIALRTSRGTFPATGLAIERRRGDWLSFVPDRKWSGSAAKECLCRSARSACAYNHEAPSKLRTHGHINEQYRRALRANIGDCESGRARLARRTSHLVQSTLMERIPPIADRHQLSFGASVRPRNHSSILNINRRPGDSSVSTRRGISRDRIDER